jgi:uncharacterized protein YciI
MNCFAVIREAGDAWSDGGIVAQPAVDDHARFMNALADEGFVHLAGPLAGSEQGRLRVLLIVEAADAEEIRRRLADDPWATSDHLHITSIEPWSVLVGATRLGHITGQRGTGPGNEGLAQVSAIT